MISPRHSTDPKELSTAAADMAAHARGNLVLLFNLDKHKHRPQTCVRNNPEDCFEVARCDQCVDNKNNG